MSVCCVCLLPEFGFVRFVFASFVVYLRWYFCACCFCFEGCIIVLPSFLVFSFSLLLWFGFDCFVCYLRLVVVMLVLLFCFGCFDLVWLLCWLLTCWLCCLLFVLVLLCVRLCCLDCIGLFKMLGLGLLGCLIADFGFLGVFMLIVGGDLVVCFRVFWFWVCFAWVVGCLFTCNSVGYNEYLLFLCLCLLDRLVLWVCLVYCCVSVCFVFTYWCLVYFTFAVWV